MPVHRRSTAAQAGRNGHPSNLYGLPQQGPSHIGAEVSGQRFILRGSAISGGSYRAADGRNAVMFAGGA
jgi:hypothetical protein